MSLMDALQRTGQLSPPSIPELRYVQAAADRVRDRWPDVQVAKNEKEREALAQKLRARVEGNDWEDVRLSFVVAAASALFDPDRRDRTDLEQTRAFIYDEIVASTSETLLTGLLRAYFESYAPNAAHTCALATALDASTPRMSASGKLLLQAVPEFLDPASGPDRLAARMSKMADPYVELLRLGVRNPHGSGFMDLAHLSLTELVKPHLSERSLIDWYIKWLRPPGKDEARNTGAEAAIEALIHPWMEKHPEDKLRSHLVETLIELYGDPRIKSGGAWGAIDERHLAIVHRWLTREDMRFFTGVVDATQKDAMWPPRRDFWLKLYDEGKIDAAWAALSSEAFEYARQHLMRQDAKNAYTRVGYQRARQNTSLLIMKIGNKIMVDGCHSYRTHVFDVSDPMAPKLFEEGYDCDEIMRASDQGRSDASKPHHSIQIWSRWVRDKINADMPWSQQKRPYTKVYRPRPPRPRNTSFAKPSGYPYPERRVSTGNIGLNNATQDLFRQTIPGSGLQRSSATLSARPGFAAQPADPATLSAKRDHEREISETPKQIASPAKTKAEFSSLTDLMVRYGPEAASAVLDFLEGPLKNHSDFRLSPKSEKGLKWVIAAKGDMPLQLRNALEYLLINMKRGGVDLDALFAKGVLSPPSSSESFPALPDDVAGRLEVMRTYSAELQSLGIEQGTFEERKVISTAIRKLRYNSPDLRPNEIGELQLLYEKLRQNQNRGRA